MTCPKSCEYLTNRPLFLWKFVFSSPRLDTFPKCFQQNIQIQHLPLFGTNLDFKLAPHPYLTLAPVFLETTPESLPYNAVLMQSITGYNN